MEAAGVASKRVEATESVGAVWMGAATEAVTRTEASLAQSPEGTRRAWVEASMGVGRAAVGVVVGVAAGAEARVPGMAAAAMGTTKAVAMGSAKEVAGTEGSQRGFYLQRC